MEPLLLLQGVRHVSELALPLDPKRASQRMFDKARPGSDFPDLPVARHIARSLRMGWAEVLALAHEPESVQARLLGYKQTDNLNGYLTTEYVVFVLKLVARRLGTRTLSLSDYSAERDEMLRHDRAHWLYGRQLILPSEGQIRTLMGSWDKALASAGLAAPRAERGGGSSKVRAPELQDLLERFYSHYEVQPTSRDVETFARANGIPYRGLREISFGQALAEWKEWRAGQGLSVPSTPPPPSERADYTHDVGAARPGETRRQERPLEEYVEWMCRYLEELPTSRRSTRLSYQNWARQHGGPSPSMLDLKHGGFSRVRRLAQDRMRAERSSKPSSPAP